MEKIINIQYPYVITDKGNRYHAKELSGQPRQGYGINEEMEVVNLGAVDVDCPGGSCPRR